MSAVAPVQPASAAVPSDEEIARLIDPERFRSHDSVRSYSIREGYGEEEAQLRADWFHPLAWPREKARAVLALFAPILAEKERQLTSFRQCVAMHRDRALAAEAALAAERERCARIAQNQVREADSEWAEGFSVAAAGIASAIRAQTR